MELCEAIDALDRLPPIEGTYWGDAIIACREAARRIAAIKHPPAPGTLGALIAEAERRTHG